MLYRQVKVLNDRNEQLINMINSKLFDIAKLIETAYQYDGNSQVFHTKIKQALVDQALEEGILSDILSLALDYLARVLKCGLRFFVGQTVKFRIFVG